MSFIIGKEIGRKQPDFSNFFLSGKLLFAYLLSMCRRDVP